jgi:hypothetical protein
MSELFLQDHAAPMRIASVSPPCLSEGGYSGWEGVQTSLAEFAQLPNAYQLLENIFDIKNHKVAGNILNEW